MNHIYKTVYNAALGTWVAVSELTTGKTKNSSKTNKIIRPLLATGLLAASSSVWALPTGDQLVAGQATVTTPTATQMQINQASDRAIMNWQNFSVGQNEAVHIQQPNQQATLLNRVIGQNASQIQGKIQANGQVYLVNPNGVLFSKTAQVDVGGLVATTHDIKNADFMNGKNQFTQNGATGKVENQGNLTANGGVIALIGESVNNSGLINTPKGSTVLAAGKTVELDMKGDGLVEVKISEAALNSQIQQHGAINADGGRVVLTAKAANNLMDTVINQNGIIKAQGLIERNGEIILEGGDNGKVTVNGAMTTQGIQGGNISVKGKDITLTSTSNLNASGDTKGGNIIVLADMNKGQVNVQGNLHADAKIQGNGGFIETSAAKVKVADSANVSTKATQGQSGTWLIDPTDFTVATSGGDMTGKAVSSALTGGNFTIQSTAGSQSGNGDININDNIEWVANKLTLNALRNININADMNGSGTAKLSLKYGQDAVTKNNTADYNINNGAKIYLPEGDNFDTQLGSNGVVQNYTVITRLGVAGSTTATDLQGMDGNLTKNYALGADIDASSTKDWNTGAGFSPIGLASDTVFTGRFDGLGHSIKSLTTKRAIGGLFGSVIAPTGGTTILSNLELINSTIEGASPSSTLYNTGALAGMIQGVTVKNVGASVNILGCYSCITAGLVGYSLNSTISNSFSMGNITASSGYLIGGLLGLALNTTVINSYSTANVTANVTGSYAIGGLVGLSSNGTFTNSYAAGKVTGCATTTGGFIGISQNTTINNSFWDKQTSAQTKGIGNVTNTTSVLTGLTTAQMQKKSTFKDAGWSISDEGGSNAIWRIYEGKTYPLLRSFLIPLTVQNKDNTISYINSITGKTITPDNNLLTTNSGSLYSNQYGYDISEVTIKTPPVKVEDTPHDEHVKPLVKIIKLIVFPKLDDQLVSLQFQTVFWNWLRYSSRFEEVDFDFGQYKHHPYQIRLLDYGHYKKMGKHRWHDKVHFKAKLKELYQELLLLIENGGIKLPITINIKP